MHVQLYPTLRSSTGSADVSVLCVNVGDIMGKCITRGKWFNYCDVCIQGVTKLTQAPMPCEYVLRVVCSTA